MLHLIFQLIPNSPVLQRIVSEDDVVFLENAVFKVNKESMLKEELQKMVDNNIHCYVLQSEIETRGFSAEQIFTGIKVIDYTGLVKLTEKNEVIHSWN